MSCKAKQYSDQMSCHRCGLSWDMNDPHPPKCLTTKQIGNKALKAIRATIKKPPEGG